MSNFQYQNVKLAKIIATTLVAASSDPGEQEHEFSGRIWAFCKRKFKKRDHSLSQH